MQEKLYLEDLAVGMSFEAGPLQVTQEEIILYARQFDPQPFHTDPEAAKDTFFKGLAASGWHTAAMTMRLLVDGGAPFADGIIGGGGDIVWPRAVRPGDVLRVVSEIVEIVPSRSRPGQAVAKMRSTTFNQNDEPVQVLNANLMVFARPA
jgi:acyl dehydratase